jgi:hypothetical protein
LGCQILLFFSCFWSRWSLEEQNWGRWCFEEVLSCQRRREISGRAVSESVVEGGASLVCVQEEFVVRVWVLLFLLVEQTLWLRCKQKERGKCNGGDTCISLHCSREAAEEKCAKARSGNDGRRRFLVAHSVMDFSRGAFCGLAPLARQTGLPIDLRHKRWGVGSDLISAFR